ncbi:hypothetical protein Q3G72_017811 [Acer saccharum]|nr:hypothetical protein Q3G72_017811 [Acer saccharum]
MASKPGMRVSPEKQRKPIGSQASEGNFGSSSLSLVDLKDVSPYVGPAVREPKGSQESGGTDCLYLYRLPKLDRQYEQDTQNGNVSTPHNF